MSLAATSAVWRMTVGDPTRKLILMKYADHAHSDGRTAWCRPRVVAEFAECSERTVQRHLTVLVAEGYMREGDQSAYVWPKAYTGSKDERYQPIVYDVAMDEETRQQWQEEAANGGTRREKHAAAGSVRRGDNLTPQEIGDENPQVSRGDNLTPQGPENESEVTPETPLRAQPEVTLVSPKEPSFTNRPSEEALPENSGDASTPKRRGRPPVQDIPRPDVDALCTLLADLIEANGSKRPTISQEWRTECRRMLDLDKRDPVKAANLIRWCQASAFWRPNVMSMPTFREKYDQLRLQALAEHERSRGETPGGRQAPPPPPGSSVWDKPPTRAERRPA